MEFGRKSERIEHLNPEQDEEMVLMDLSVTGACCIHDNKKEKGSILTLRIDDSRFESKVVYCQQIAGAYRLGLQFSNLSADAKHDLVDFVDRFSKGVPLDCEVEDDDKSEEVD